MHVDDIVAQIPPEIRRELVENKLQMWRNTVADARLDATVAQAIDDAQMQAQAAQRLKRALQAVAVLEQKLAEIPEPEDDSS